jgi:STE24 endopeptidase
MTTHGAYRECLIPRTRALACTSIVVKSLFVLLLLGCAPAENLPAHVYQAQAVYPAASAAAAAVPSQRVTAYTLPPDLYRKARNLSRIRFRLALLGFVYGVFVLWLLLRFRVAPKYRDWAERFSSNTFLQSAIFVPLLLLTIAVMTLPLDVYGEWVEKQYGISVQSWGSWSWDWTKAEIVALVISTVLIWLLYRVISRSPRRWWFYFWLLSLPILLFIFFIQPWVIDPLFNQFEPLEKKDPELVVRLGRMVRRAGEDIPPQRMFWMNAGQKTTDLNAYVTGVGASKRVVVWDTTIVKMNTDQITFVVGHETGHYVLHHIPKLLIFLALMLLAFFYAGYRSISYLLRKWQHQWAVRSPGDWASLPAFMLLLTIFSFIASPLTSAVSRHYERQADQYGLEVTHGLTPDSNQVAAQAFQTSGEVGLSDPDPNPVQVFLFYDHPSASERVRYCLSYDPWSKGEHGEFVK